MLAFNLLDMKRLEVYCDAMTASFRRDPICILSYRFLLGTKLRDVFCCTCQFGYFLYSGGVYNSYPIRRERTRFFSRILMFNVLNSKR